MSTSREGHLYGGDIHQLTSVAAKSTLAIKGVTQGTLETGPKIKDRENNVPQDAKIDLIIDPSLLDHFTENLSRRNSSASPEDAITSLVATILDGSEFPVSAVHSGKNEIRISYHLRSFSQPFFE